MPDGGWLVASGTRVDVGGVAVAVVLGGGDVASVTAAFAAWAGLTSRETQVIRRIGEGLDNRSTARSPMISPLTVETRLTSIYRKSGVRGRDELLALLR